jgi:hypothetical protein
MGFNSSLEDTEGASGERKWSKSSDENDGEYWGFTSLTIDTTSNTPNGNWKVTSEYRRFDTGESYKTQVYVLSNDEFIYS